MAGGRPWPAAGPQSPRLVIAFGRRTWSLAWPPAPSRRARTPHVVTGPGDRARRSPLVTAPGHRTWSLGPASAPGHRARSPHLLPSLATHPAANTPATPPGRRHPGHATPGRQHPGHHRRRLARPDGPPGSPARPRRPRSPNSRSRSPVDIRTVHRPLARRRGRSGSGPVGPRSLRTRLRQEPAPGHRPGQSRRGERGGDAGPGSPPVRPGRADQPRQQCRRGRPPGSSGRVEEFHRRLTRDRRQDPRHPRERRDRRRAPTAASEVPFVLPAFGGGQGAEDVRGVPVAVRIRWRAHRLVSPLSWRASRSARRP